MLLPAAAVAGYCCFLLKGSLFALQEKVHVATALAAR
jgi:hypothetical protein